MPLASKAVAAPDVAGLLAEDAVRDRTDRTPYRYAQFLPLDLDSQRHGSWSKLADGSAVWRVLVSSAGAESLQLELAEMALPPGAKWWWYDPVGTTVHGPYLPTSRHGHLWTPIVRGEQGVLEVQLAPSNSSRLDVSSVTAPEVRVAALGYGYRGFAWAPKQLGCNLDTICPEAEPYRDQVRAVARIAFERNGFGFLCSGTLLNNHLADLRPFFLTANHCIAQQAHAASVVVYWNFESPVCGELGGGDLSSTQLGATLRATHFATDTTLIELDAVPPANFQVFYAGWDATGVAPSSSVGIHHPAGDEKAIAFENSPLLTDGDFWEVDAWDVGTTEQGSSGSCVFDSVSRRCIGALSEGTAGCNTTDIYGKLSVAWDGGGTSATRFRDWLDPLASGVRTLAGANPDDHTCSAGETLCLADGRFRVSTSWETAGGSGTAKAVQLTTDTGFFWFFAETNLEVVVKVIDGCAFNQHYWVFAGGLTDVEVAIRVEDTSTGELRTYRNRQGTAFAPIQDTNAFAGCE